jgi:hypothetical protein
VLLRRSGTIANLNAGYDVKQTISTNAAEGYRQFTQVQIQTEDF